MALRPAERNWSGPSETTRMSTTVIYCIRCARCSETRVGEKELGGDVEPFVDECPECGATGYTVPALD